MNSEAIEKAMAAFERERDEARASSTRLGNLINQQADLLDEARAERDSLRDKLSAAELAISESASTIEIYRDDLTAAERRIEELVRTLKGYELWEADLLLSERAWGGKWPGGRRDLPQIPQPLWDRLLDLQTERNAALRSAPVTPQAQTGVMQSAAEAAERVAAMSPAKQEYIARVVGTQTTGVREP